MNIETLETILVVFIVSIQFVIFLKTKRQITVFRNIIPETSALEVSKIFVPNNEIDAFASKEILANALHYKTTQNPEGEENEEISEITIIECDKNKNAIFEKILHSINTYLLRNRNATSDFNLIKDMTERNTDAIEEDINLTISIPLFLGLMGTMGGIIIGLLSMSSLTLTGNPGGDNLGQGITILLGGVKIAMFASLIGLTLTTINSGWFFKGSKSLVEAKKNEFYTFIQTELLPAVNQSLGSTFESLHRNLSKFNDEFSNNLTDLSGIFSTNNNNLVLQKEILTKIENIDMATIARFNINVLKELQVSTKEFEKFNTHFSNINSYVNNSATLVDRLNTLLERTDNLKKIADTLDDRLSQSKELLDFLSKHFKDLEEYKKKTSESVKKTEDSISEMFGEYKQQTVQTVADAGHSISDAFKDLRTQMEGASKELKDFTVQELEVLKNTMSESKTNLDNLEYLEIMTEDISQFKDSTASQSERIRMLLQDVNKNLETSITKLISIERSSLALRRKGIRDYVKKLFNPNGE